jgi:Cdc6-like AAA superfamily ATPase
VIKDEQTRIRLLLGTTGTGKTTLMEKLLKAEDRCIVFDMMAATQFEQWGVLCDTYEDALTLMARTPKFHIRLQLKDPDKFDRFCSLFVKKPHGLEKFHNVCVAVDEISRFCSSNWIPDKLDDIIRLGRHTNCRFIATSQRPTDVHINIRANSKEIYLFQMHEPADLDAFRKRVPNPERLIQLKVGEYILWNPSAMQSPTNDFSQKR